jgi:hypothetical protein
MYRVIAIVGAGLALAACSSTPDWMNLSALKPAPVLDTVSFESNPPGADVKTSNGQSCRAPCALALPTETPLTATFTLNGYLPETDTLDPVSITGGPPQLQPNPVSAELELAPPPAKAAKPAKKPAPKKKTAATAKPAAANPAPASTAPAAQQPASPWPAPQPAPR